MLTRIVKMTFAPEKVNDFLSLFNANKHLIASFEGCSLLELHRDINSPTVYFTYSKWQSEKHLENYRNSELFNSVWRQTKVLFAAKPEAWSISGVFSSEGNS